MTLIRDFEGVERAHSKPKWEYKLIDGGETAAVVETNPIGGGETIHYIPTRVLLAVADDIANGGGD